MLAWRSAQGTGGAGTAISLPPLRCHHDGAASGARRATLLFQLGDRAGAPALRRQTGADAASAPDSVCMASELRVAAAVEHAEQVAQGGLGATHVQPGTPMATKLRAEADG